MIHLVYYVILAINCFKLVKESFFLNGLCLQGHVTQHTMNPPLLCNLCILRLVVNSARK